MEAFRELIRFTSAVGCDKMVGIIKECVMRFRDMVAAGIGKDRKALKPKPYVDDTVAIGHKVRCKWDGHKDVIGTVVAASRAGTCWVIEIRKSNKHGQHWTVLDEFKKCYCERIRSSEMSKVARGKSEATTEPVVFEEIYGDGDV